MANGVDQLERAIAGGFGQWLVECRCGAPFF
jgi:hypothetical protein